MLYLNTIIRKIDNFSFGFIIIFYEAQMTINKIIKITKYVNSIHVQTFKNPLYYKVVVLWISR